ncbi:RabGAP/TBC [Conidiobolus coronatus NRRL 28638]|uniref:RabGAP/TBC n=1 Tax=Conidiobolus coronatus (strain ATCC 28846 / CBS 209.66 / NRRL 28638) TaxID=796925 RepID=A0A137NWM8_CONC2|nr:RabGAP/TBC [Conidiobolus coronatus NRRL 28638]|eukprot:KXN67088.1 RabGAP/TBC [Conidiobolus coronatus NRRL 28638]
MSVDDDQEDEDIDWDFWGKLVNDYELMTKKNKQIVEQHLIQGIPVSLRGTLWQLMSKSQSVDMENVYVDLLKRTSPYEKLISQDLSRTYPSLTYFRREGGHGQESLFNVVKCYSLYDPEVGYCQGLPFIVGPLLLNMPDEEAFCMLTKLMTQWDLRQHFVPNMIGLQIRTYQFERLMEMFFPNISIHLERQGVQSSMYASQWFMTLFGYRSSMKIVFRVIDMLLFEGTNVLFKLALTLLKLGEAKILSLEFEQLLNYLKIDIFQTFQEQTSLVISESRQFQIPERKLKQWAKEYTAELKRLTEEEKLVNTLSANNQQLEERVKSLDSKVQDLTNGQLEMANDYVQVQTDLANQKQHNRSLQAKIEELEARLKTERQLAEESLKDHLEQLAQKNLSLVTKNMELEDQLHSTEQLLMGARNKIANYETGGTHSASSSLSGMTDAKSVNSTNDPQTQPATTKKWGAFRSILS